MGTNPQSASLQTLSVSSDWWAVRATLRACRLLALKRPSRRAALRSALGGRPAVQQACRSGVPLTQSGPALKRERTVSYGHKLRNLLLLG